MLSLKLYGGIHLHGLEKDRLRSTCRRAAASRAVSAAARVPTPRPPRREVRGNAMSPGAPLQFVKLRVEAGDEAGEEDAGDAPSYVHYIAEVRPRAHRYYCCPTGRSVHH